LAFRDFYADVLHHWPASSWRNWNSDFDGIQTDTGAEAKRRFEAWKAGETGFPFVDAGMRQLRDTGFMHNRVRMIVASFLIKDLLIDWREGERWFRDTLVDIDCANNAMNWQWVAGCGADASPWFRIFNPVKQGETFDTDGAYVRRHCPELARLPGKYIHRPFEAPRTMLEEAGVTLGETYPAPIVAHDKARDRALRAFKSLPKTNAS
jgi:deoxyribodipyrimidine photo-lyase